MPTKQTIPPPIIMLGFALLMRLLAPMLPQVHIPLTARMVIVLGCVGLSALFGIGGLWAFKQQRTTTSPNHDAAVVALVRDGVYRFSRNPMYLGLSLLLIALVFWLQTPLLFLGVAGFIWTMNTLQIKPEEAKLQHLFGQAYRDYQAQVRRWI